MNANRTMDAMGSAGPPFAMPDFQAGPVVALTLRELLSREFPPHEVLLDPWLCSQSLNMLYGWRGLGKTHVSIGVAYALASGGAFLRWHAARPVKVLFIDGEMPANRLQARFAAVAASAELEPEDGFLQIVTPDTQLNGIPPNLATAEGRAAIDVLAENAEVIIVDNISCLVRSTEKENDAASWTAIAGWALRHRAHGRTIIFVHHAGKGGQQRGTSKREDVLDVVIALRRPSDYQESEGARFEVHFEKARPESMHGRNADPFEARLDSGPDGLPMWTMRDCKDTLGDRISECAALGMSPNVIAQELGCSRATVYRYLKDQARMHEPER